jgi:hypothetical protein
MTMVGMGRAVTGGAGIAAIAAAGLTLGDPVTDGVAAAIIAADHIVGVNGASTRTVTDNAGMAAGATIPGLRFSGNCEADGSSSSDKSEDLFHKRKNLVFAVL